MPRERWTNWIGDQSCECEVVTPRSLAELCKVVAERSRVGRIRVAGNSYSWSPLIPNRDTIIRMDYLKRLIRIAPAREGEKGSVEVECGMTIAELTSWCARAGHALVSPTLFPRPQLGGAIATGAHGTGFGVGCFADSILEMTIVKHDGSLVTIKRGDADYDAAKVALGTFGVLYSVKLRTAPDYAVYTEKVLVPVDAVLDGFADLLTSCQYLEMFWFPFQKSFWVYLMDDTELWPDEKTWFAARREKVSKWIQNTGGSVLTPWIARHLPGMTPFLNKMAIKMSDRVGVTVAPASDAFHFQKAYPKNWDCSYSVPAQDARRAWREAIDLVEQFGAQGLYPVNLALHCRFLGASTAWLAGNHARESCMIEAATAKGTPHWRDFYRQLEQRWFAIPGSRPHWAKVYSTARQVGERYERMGDFLAKRQAWDPDRVFLNDFLENEVFHLR